MAAVGILTGLVLGAGALMLIGLLPKVAERLRSPDKSISTLVWIGAFAILVAFGCQMAAVWLA